MRPLMTIDRSSGVTNVAAFAGKANHVVASAVAKQAYFMFVVQVLTWLREDGSQSELVCHH